MLSPKRWRLQKINRHIPAKQQGCASYVPAASCSFVSKAASIYTGYLCLVGFRSRFIKLRDKPFHLIGWRVTHRSNRHIIQPRSPRTWSVSDQLLCSTHSLGCNTTTRGKISPFRGEWRACARDVLNALSAYSWEICWGWPDVMQVGRSNAHIWNKSEIRWSGTVVNIDLVAAMAWTSFHRVRRAYDTSPSWSES